MPTPTEAFYARMMLTALSHCEPGRRLFTGANAGGTVADGEVISQRSTYPDWYGKLCETESGDAIRRNLALIAAGKENRRGGFLTKGWARVMKAVQFVMANGDQESLIWPDPTFIRELGRDEEADSLAAYLAAMAEASAETPDDLPDSSESLREFANALDPRVSAAIPALAPYSSKILVRGWFTWPTPVDAEARQALEKVGYKWSIKDQCLYGPPALAQRLPVRPCHHMPTITATPY